MSAEHIAFSGGILLF